MVAAAAALATGELVAALTAGTPSPLIAVGTAVIDFAPPGSKEVIVALFGTNDKIALNLLVAATVLAAGAAIGLIARRSTLLASLLIVALVGVGTAASLRDPTATQTFVLLSAALQVAAGLLVLEFLLDAARPRTSADGSPVPPDAVRRGFLVRAGVLGALAIVGQGIGRAMLDARAASAASAAVTVPEPVDPAVTIAPENAFAIEGITPLVIPNEDFYRIDTALVTPAVDVDSWTLRVHGMVDREVTLTFPQLVELPLIERYVTIACVSNEVGGDLIGNAKWTGVRLTDVLDMAGVQAGATQVVPRSVDGWAAGFPTEWVTDPERPRDALIAVKMNDEPLPVAHGFPARLIVPGLYGYVSATKWLKEIELTTWEAFDSYWVPRGWSKEAPILTQSRIDVPRQNSQHRQGETVQVAGVAWAMDRGVSKVEVRVDEGEWQPATLDLAARARRRGSSGGSPGLPSRDATPSGSVPRTARAWSRRSGSPARTRTAPAGTTRCPCRSTERASGTLPRLMPRRRYLFDTPDRFVAGTVGAPGNRTFFLQARDGTRIVSVALEKVQVAVLAQRLGDLLEELERRGIEGTTEQPGLVGDTAAMDEPINEAFRVGTLSLGWDTTDEMIVIEARELVDVDEEDVEEDADEAFVDDDDEDGPDLLRVRITPAYAQAFIARATRLVAAGRPPCPLCGQPLDPQGHLCPRRNGHRLN